MTRRKVSPPLPASTSPLFVALAGAQAEQDIDTISQRLSNALPFADRMLAEGLFSLKTIATATRAFGLAHASNYEEYTAMFETVTSAAEGEPGDFARLEESNGHRELYSALVMSRADDTHMAYLIGLAVGLRIAGGA